MSDLVTPMEPVREPLPVEERVSHLIEAYQNQVGVVETEKGAVLIDEGPLPLYHPTTGELIGYEMWVRYFTSEGDEGVDPHRQFLYPPDGRAKEESGDVVELVPVVNLVDDIIRETVTP